MPKIDLGKGSQTSVPGQKESKDIEKEAGALFSDKKRKKKDVTGPDYGYQRIRLHKSEELNVYAQEQDARMAMDKRAKTLIVLGVALLAAFILTCILPKNIFGVTGRVDHTIGGFAGETAEGFVALLSFFTGTDSMYGTIVFTIIVAMISGAAMGVSGGVLQGVLKNAIASPSTLGIMSGGTIGTVLYIIFVLPNSISTNFAGSITEYMDALEQLDPVQYVMQIYGSFICSLAGCALVVFLVMVMALIAGRGKVSNVSLVVAGQVFSATIVIVVQRIEEFYRVHGDAATVEYLQTAQSTTFTGSYTLVSVMVFAIPVLICIALIFILSGKMSLLAFSDEEARSMGISTTAFRNVVVALCTILTAFVVSFAGPVSFVGFIVPHMARRMMGPDLRYLLPASALLGAILVVVVYYFTELGIPGIASGSTGVFTGIIGCALFLVTALRTRRSAGAEWF